VKITDAIHEFILYKQSLGMTYKNRALKLTAFARLAGPVEIDSISPETINTHRDAIDQGERLRVFCEHRGEHGCNKVSKFGFR